jgi:hypothetical protein
MHYWLSKVIHIKSHIVILSSIVLPLRANFFPCQTSWTFSSSLLTSSSFYLPSSSSLTTPPLQYYRSISCGFTADNNKRKTIGYFCISFSRKSCVKIFSGYLGVRSSFPPSVRPSDCGFSAATGSFGAPAEVALDEEISGTVDGLPKASAGLATEFWGNSRYNFWWYQCRLRPSGRKRTGGSCRATLWRGRSRCHRYYRRRLTQRYCRSGCRVWGDYRYSFWRNWSRSVRSGRKKTLGSCRASLTLWRGWSLTDRSNWFRCCFYRRRFNRSCRFVFRWWADRFRFGGSGSHFRSGRSRNRFLSRN